MSTEEPAPKDLFLDSLNRCAASDNFIPAFYDRFLASSDEVQAKFEDTDFTVQNRMLLRSPGISISSVRFFFSRKISICSDSPA